MCSASLAAGMQLDGGFSNPPNLTLYHFIGPYQTPQAWPDCHHDANRPLHCTGAAWNGLMIRRWTMTSANTHMYYMANEAVRFSPWSKVGDEPNYLNKTPSASQVWFI
jgi:hypothetical protein